MSFSCQRVVYFLIYHFKNWLLIVYMRAQRGYKYWQIDKSENKKSARFDKYKSNDKYILFSPFLPQTKSNRLSNLGERTRSLTYLVSIKKKIMLNKF